MPARTLMIQGTSSAAGKSLLCTALGRIFRQEGLRVVPFKAQNLALNSAVTLDGAEIGRAQALQAQACGVEASADMNPVLLKPEGGMRTQVVLNGKTWKSVGPGEWDECRPRLWQAVSESLDRLRARSDLVIIEGAGSPVEINLTKNEIVNMRVARHCGAPVLLAASIELGGMFAALVGTLALLDPEEKALVKGFVVNRFHGDPALLQPGLAMLEDLTEGRPTLGIIPFIEDLRLPQEDAAALPPRATTGRGVEREAGGIDIAVLHLPHLSNVDDCDALAGEEGVSVRFVAGVADLGRPDAVLIPGSKATLADLGWLAARGFPHAVRALADAGAAVVGICGGYQMLGLSVRDPRGTEGAPTAQRGLGLLPVETELETGKTTRRACATVSGGAGFLRQCVGARVEGYEIHGAGPFLPGSPPRYSRARTGQRTARRPATARVWGTYLHGVFDAPGFRRAWLRSLGWEPAGDARPAGATLDSEIDRVAGIVAGRLDMARLRSVAAL